MQRLLDRAPFGAAPFPVPPDPLGHLAVKCPGRRQVAERRAELRCQLFGEAAFTAACAAGYEDCACHSNPPKTTSTLKAEKPRSVTGQGLENRGFKYDRASAPRSTEVPKQ